MSDTNIQCHTTSVDDYSIHYRECGDGPPVLLLHGWPTSSFLWRNVMPHLAPKRRVLAIDLPAFGKSDKPLDIEYTLDFYATILDGFLDAVGVDEPIGLTVHDMGGPVGLYWASQNNARLESLAVLNTLVYPELSWAVRTFLFTSKLPGALTLMTSQRALSWGLKFGVHDTSRLRPDALEGFCAPFRDPDARQALLQTLYEITPADLEPIADWLPTVTAPVQVVYGGRDRILPAMSKTVARLQEDVPHADVECFEDCGHFFQEERPEELAHTLAKFFT